MFLLKSKKESWFNNCANSEASSFYQCYILNNHNTLFWHKLKCSLKYETVKCPIPAAADRDLVPRWFCINHDLLTLRWADVPMRETYTKQMTPWQTKPEILVRIPRRNVIPSRRDRYFHWDRQIHSPENRKWEDPGVSTNRRHIRGSHRIFHNRQTLFFFSQ